MNWDLLQHGETLPMRQWFAYLAALALLVSGCASGEPPPPPEAPPPIVRAPAAAPFESASPPSTVRDGVVFPDIPSDASSRVSTVSPLPPRPPLYPMTPP